MKYEVPMDVQKQLNKGLGIYNKLELIGNLEFLKDTVDLLKENYEKLWLRCAKPNGLQIILEKFDATIYFYQQKIRQIQDGVIWENPFIESEFITAPEKVIDEMYRILKPGGRVYVMMPFIFNFHAAPNDYYRYTHHGLAHQMRRFKKLQMKIIGGPTSALTCVLVEWCAMLFSFGSRRLYKIFSLIFLVVFAPLKLFDLVLSYHPEAVRIASVMLFIGVKE